MWSTRILLLSAVAMFATATQAQAAFITAHYGDDDGFGIGATSGSLNAVVSNAEAGEDPFTDVRLIAPGFAAPAFQPTGGFSFSVPAGDTIVAATLTMRAGAWVSAPPPAGIQPNTIMLDGQAVSPTFFTMFTNTTDQIETRTIALSPAFLAALADGSVSLNGSFLSEQLGAGSFQIDFLRLDITTENAVPVPAGAVLFGLGMVSLGGARLIRRRPTAA